MRKLALHASWQNIQNSFAAVNSHTAILTKPSEFLRLSDMNLHPSGRITSALAHLPTQTLRLVCIYAPADRTEIPQFFALLNDFLSSYFPELPLLLGGDFNCVDDSELDSSSPTAVNQGGYELGETLANHTLSDPFRRAYPTRRTFTNSSAGAHRRLDRFYVTPGLISISRPLQESSPPRGASSTHKIIKLSLRISNPTIGPPSFRFSPSWLDITWYRESLRQEIVHLKRALWDPDHPTLERWDHLKAQIRQVIEDMSRKSANFYRTHDPVEWELHILRGKTARAKYPPHLAPAAESAALDIRIKQLKERAYIEKLKNAEGKRCISTSDIGRTLHQYYSTLYSPKPCDQTNLLALRLELGRHLDTDQITQLEMPFDPTEMATALKLSSVSSCPGPDGLPIAFYRAYWAELGPIISTLPELVTRTGNFSKSQRQAHIHLISKGADKEDASNWRPISLLNCDYKLITQCVVQRLLRVLPSIIHSDQCAFLPGRWIGHAIADMEEVIRRTSCALEPLGAAILDFRKAYDSVSHDYLLKVFRSYGFGTRMLSLVRATILDINSSIYFNGWFTTPVQIKSGVRQGDPLSPLLYLISLEPLCNLLRHRLQGLTIPPEPSYRKTLIAFADDLTVILRSTDDAHQLQQCLSLFETAGGVYVDQFHPLSSTYLAEIQRLVISKVWGGSRRLVDRTLLTRPLQQGGYNLWYLHQKLAGARAYWILRLTEPFTQFWQHSTRHQASVYGAEYQRPHFNDLRLTHREQHSWHILFVTPQMPRHWRVPVHPQPRWEASLQALAALKPKVITVIANLQPEYHLLGEYGPAFINPESFKGPAGAILRHEDLQNTWRSLQMAIPPFPIGLYSDDEVRKRWKLLAKYYQQDQRKAETVHLALLRALLTMDRLDTDWVNRTTRLESGNPMCCAMCRTELDSNAHVLFTCEKIQELWSATNWQNTRTMMWGPTNMKDFQLWAQIIHAIWNINWRCRYQNLQGNARQRLVQHYQRKLGIG